MKFRPRHEHREDVPRAMHALIISAPVSQQTGFKNNDATEVGQAASVPYRNANDSNQ